MSTSLGILNNIRVNASEDYQSRIPEATRNNIAEIGNALQTYTTLFNEFCEALVNKIGKTIIEQKLATNKLARFKSGAILTQQDVEEIFIEMGREAEAYDPDGKNPLGRRELPDVKAIYHRQNRRDAYVVSIGDVDFLRVFRSEATLETYFKGLINSVYSRAAHDEWLLMKNLLATYTKYATADVDGSDNATIAKNFVKTVRKLVNDVGFMSDKFNGAGVMTKSEPGELVLLVNKDIIAEVDVEVLAKSFNMGKTDIQTEIVVMDDFGSMADTYGILCDKDFFRVFDTLSHFEPQRNAQGLFTNYFYHVHQILSLSTFKNAVALKKKAA